MHFVLGKDFAFVNCETETAELMCSTALSLGFRIANPFLLQLSRELSCHCYRILFCSSAFALAIPISHFPFLGFSLHSSRAYQCDCLRIAFYCSKQHGKSSVAVPRNYSLPPRTQGFGFLTIFSVFRILGLSALGTFLVWRNRFGAINSIKMQFEGSVILNNAKSSHRVNADSLDACSTLLSWPFSFFILAKIYAISCYCLFVGYSKYLRSARRVLS